MRRSPVLLWLALLAVGLGRSFGTAPFAPPLAVRPGVEAAQEHALPAASRLRLAAAVPSWVERVRPGEAMHAAAAGAPAPELDGPYPALASARAPARPHGITGALAYFPTGPP